MNTNILLIEDEANIADNIKYALQTEGFIVFWLQLRISGMIYFQHNKACKSIIRI